MSVDFEESLMTHPMTIKDIFFAGEALNFFYSLISFCGRNI